MTSGLRGAKVGYFHSHRQICCDGVDNTVVAAAVAAWPTTEDAIAVWSVDIRHWNSASIQL